MDPCDTSYSASLEDKQPHCQELQVSLTTAMTVMMMPSLYLHE